MKPLRSTSLASLSAAVLQPTVAHACTVCDSPTGHQVRAGIFDGHFLQTLLLVVAPFPVFAAILLLLHVAMPYLPAAITWTDEPELRP